MEVDKLMKKMVLQLNPDPNSQDNDREANEMAEEYIAEYENLDSTLDQLDSCLNSLEQKNDDLVQQIQDLLLENKETTAAFKAERLAAETNNSRPEDTPKPSDSTAGAAGPSTATSQSDQVQTLEDNLDKSEQRNHKTDTTAQGEENI